MNEVLHVAGSPAKRHLRPGLMLAVGAAIATTMLAFAAVEIRHGRRTLEGQLVERGRLLIDEIERGVALAWRAGGDMEGELAARLLSAARTAARLSATGRLARADLVGLAADHEILTLHLVDAEGRIEASNRPREHLSAGGEVDFRATFPDLFAGAATETVLGLHRSPNAEAERYSVAVRRPGGGIVVAAIAADELTALRRSFGYGRLIREAGQTHGVRSVVLQDLDGVLAASASVTGVSAIAEDPFLDAAWRDGKLAWRRAAPADDRSFEVARRVRLDEENVALLRVGFDGHELEELARKARRRLLITVFGLAFFLAAAVNAMIVYRDYAAVRRAHAELASLGDAVLAGMADAVLVASPDGAVRLANQAAQRLFGEPLERLPPALSAAAARVFASPSPLVEEAALGAGEAARELVVAGSLVRPAPAEPGLAVLICRDETEQRRLERRAQQDEKLTAMGRLAAAVAHEVRNPLNAIGLTAQRLRLEFAPAADRDEYAQLLGVVAEEIARLDAIISRFLQFARAPVAERAAGDLAELVRSVRAEMQGLAASRGVRLQTAGLDELAAEFDARQMRQVLLNLLANALDAAPPDSAVTVALAVDGADAVLTVQDRGPGLSAAALARVFDLYYTTKAQGSGLGLPIARRILEAHGGGLELRSEPGAGVTAAARFPRKA